MNRHFEVASMAAPVVVLRAIEAADLEDLRLWKNANKASFFFKGEISPADQKKWFEGYLARPDDYMFVVLSGGVKAGCMGFRLLDGAADAYNIIGAPGPRAKGAMSGAMRLMCSYIQAEHSRKIGCKVLKANPALGWYAKCGYKIAAERGDHVELELDDAVFASCAYRKAEKAARR